MDESLYVGAALRILQGDIFLTKYWFDKFFLTPFVLSLGILVGGETQIGFRLAALVTSLLSIYITITWIADLAGKIFDQFVALILAAGILLLPFMIFYHVSSFTDPFLYLFLVLFSRSLYRAAVDPAKSVVHTRRAYHYFAVASLFKLSSLMWSPMLLGFWIWRSGPRGIKRGVGEFFQTTKWWIAAGVLYSLANPDKLGPILWFKHLGGGTKAQGLWSRGAEWIAKSSIPFDSGGLSFGFFLLVFSVTAGAVAVTWKRKRWGQDRFYLLVFIAPFWLHVIGLWLSGAATFPRYFYILLPQGVVAVAASLHILSTVSMASWAARLFTVGLGLCLFSSGLSYKSLAAYLPPTAFGRALFQMRDEASSGAVVHNDSLSWYLYPFNHNGRIRNACARPECFVEQRLGRRPFGSQYWLKTSQDPKLALVQAIPGCNGDKGCGVVARDYTVALTHLLDEPTIREKLRLGGWAKAVAIRVIQPNFVAAAAEGWIASPSLDVAISVTPVKHQGIDIGNLQISAQLVFLDSRFAQADLGPGRWIAALRLKKIELSGGTTNFVDLAPLLYQSYVIPLGAVDIPARDPVHEMVSAVSLETARPGSVRLTVLERKPL